MFLQDSRALRCDFPRCARLANFIQYAVGEFAVFESSRDACLFQAIHCWTRDSGTKAIRNACRERCQSIRVLTFCA